MQPNLKTLSRWVFVFIRVMIQTCSQELLLNIRFHFLYLTMWLKSNSILMDMRSWRPCGHISILRYMPGLMFTRWKPLWQVRKHLKHSQCRWRYNNSFLLWHITNLVLSRHIKVLPLRVAMPNLGTFPKCIAMSTHFLISWQKESPLIMTQNRAKEHMVNQKQPTSSCRMARSSRIWWDFIYYYIRRN